MSDHKNPFHQSYAGMAGVNDPFVARGKPAQQSPFQNHGVQSSPFANTAPPASVPPVQSAPTTTTPPPPPSFAAQQQAPPMVTPPPMPSAFAETKVEPANEKIIKGSLPGQVFHDNFQFAGGAVSADTSGFNAGKSEAELLESIKSMNTPSQFIRTSLKVLPSSTTLQQKTHIPLGLVIRPMAPLSEDDQQIPLVNHGTEPITRCTRCRTYINPFVQFDASRRYWTCNICGVSNETPMRYLNAQVGGDNEELPPELKTGLVEYVASADYMVRPPQAPAYMVSYKIYLI